MSDLKLETVDGELSGEDKAVMTKGMLDYHASQGHPRKTNHYSVLLKDRGKLVGVVVVSFLWNGMHIDSLWMDEAFRGKGWGRKLMEMAEKEGIKRRCTVAYTDTFTWQAPEFYKKLGYKQYGQIEDFPEGNSLFYFAKKLG